MSTIYDFVESYPLAFTILSVIGFSTLARTFFSLLKVAYENHAMKGVNLKRYGAGSGAYAVITGATDGIGKEFAVQLAKQKMNIVLVSRTLEKLQNVAKEIEKESGVDVKVYAMDFTKATKDDFNALADVISSLPVGILVNNVATNHSIPTPFIEEDDDILENIVNVNITGTLRMTKMVLPKMAEAKTGLILNVGSFAGQVPTPYLQTYSGSKAFLKTWSESLAAEVKPLGVHVEHLNTYFVVSNMSKIRKSSALIPSARGYVKNVLKRVGIKTSSTPYPYHNLFSWIIENFVPSDFLLRQTLDMQRATRAKALRKMQREQKAQ
ncbi:hypothetical protein MP638_007231 [Amoeboaphelidium occidentale]|nr:hypothetical protein MP638_007231 [Amoeboaphelidium occidentale]